MDTPRQRLLHLLATHSFKLGEFKLIEDLMSKARKIYDAEEAPERNEKCRDCKRMDVYMRQSRGDASLQDKLRGVSSFVDNNGKRRYFPVVADWRIDYDAILGEDNDDWFPEWMLFPQ